MRNNSLIGGGTTEFPHAKELLDAYPTSYTKINSKEANNLNITAKTIRL